ALEASMTARIPDPQTLCSVMHGTESGIPAPSEAWRAGAWPMPACRTLPMITCSMSDGLTSAFSSAPLIATDPSAGRDVPVRGGLGDWETGRLGDWETGRLGDWETLRVDHAVPNPPVPHVA